jgi:hypothetical protein
VKGLHVLQDCQGAVLVTLQHCLQDGQEGSPQEALNWIQNADAWASRLLSSFPLYRDLLQPVALAVQEVRAGLAMQHRAMAAAEAADDALQLTGILAQLMSFPPINTGRGAFRFLLPQSLESQSDGFL